MSERTDANKARDRELREMTAARLEDVARRLRAGETEIEGVHWAGYGIEDDWPAALGPWLARSIAERELGDAFDEAQAEGEWPPDTCRIGWGVEVRVEHAVAERGDPITEEDDEGNERETGEHYVDFGLEPIGEVQP